MTLPPIVSVDDHIMEPPDLWLRRLPAKFKDVGPRVERLPWEYGAGFRQPWKVAQSGPVADCWIVDDMRQFIAGVTVSVGFAPEEVKFTPVSYEDMRPGCYELKARLEDMDIAKVERSLCFPNIARFCGQLLHWIKDKELALACVQAYNDWIVEEWASESGGRIMPVCLIPLWDPQLAVAEVRRNAARGVRAVAFSELPTALELPSIHDPNGYWIPFIEACNETQTVICIHIGSSSTIPETSPDAPAAVLITIDNFNAQLCLADWLFSGLLPRYPNLKLAFSESQLGWMPYVFERADEVWRAGKQWAQIHPSIEEPPSSYVKGRLYACFFNDEFGVASRDVIGVDQITFETDYPHQDTTWPNTSQALEKMLVGLTDGEVHKIARGNALHMLGLPDTLLPGTAA